MIFMKIMQTIIFNARGPTGLSQLGSSQFNNKPEESHWKSVEKEETNFTNYYFNSLRD